VSPPNRRSDSQGGRGYSTSPGMAGAPGPEPPPNALFAEMLRAARELLAVRSPLDAELMVSELLGTWWGQRPGPAGPRDARHRRTDVEELVGEGLVAYAGEQGSPAALALLSGIACLGTPRQAVRAERAALALMERGVARPGWAEHVGAVEAAECYVNSDAFGDRDEVVCVFSYAGREQHALVTVVDYNAGGLVRDGWVTSQVDKLIEVCRQAAGLEGDEDQAAVPRPGQASFTRIDAPQARRLLASALAVTESAADPPVSSSFPSYHAFIRARIRTLPPAMRLGGTAATSASAAWVPVTSPARRQIWRRDRRAMLVAQFLASDEAEDLSDREAASRCADRIVDYGCDRDFGRPLRVSPSKAETFLLDWLPRKIMLTAADQDAIPHVLAAWVRWAGGRSGLDSAAIGKTLDAVFDSMGTFSRLYRDPVSFGLDSGLVARLLPDHDLEALPRRAFAFPLLQGTYHGTDLGILDPAKPADRRTLLAADHGGSRQASGEHLEDHLALADRLWRGDPPELWEAAQRLLDLGEDRHAVEHALISAIRAAGRSEPQIAAALSALPPEEPGRQPRRRPRA
jgi:hypothetical protein